METEDSDEGNGTYHPEDCKISEEPVISSGFHVSFLVLDAPGNPKTPKY